MLPKEILTQKYWASLCELLSGIDSESRFVKVTQGLLRPCISSGEHEQSIYI